jgi:hypothetical protein
LAATWDDINFANYFGSINALSDITSQQGIGLVPWFVKRTSQGYNSFLDLNGEFDTYGIQHKVLLDTDHYLLDYSDTFNVGIF